MFYKQLASGDVVNVQLDKVATASNVTDFLHNNLAEYLANAGMNKADLSSPQLNGTGVSHGFENSAESNMLKIFDYENKCWAIGCAINNCSKVSRQILQSSILKELSDYDQIMRLNYSDRTFYRKKQEALCEFATRIQFWAYKYNTHIAELRIYQEKENKV